MKPWILRWAGALASAAALATAIPAAAAPPMWVIKDAHSTVYLFGTVHVLRPQLQWRTPAMDKALADSTELLLETDAVADPAKAQGEIMTLGLDPGHPLSAKLTAADAQRLAAAAQTLGAPLMAVDQMKPWLASMTLTVVPIVKAGYDAKSGVELTLTGEAKAAGKKISGFETLDQQIHKLADMPDALQVEMLSSTLADIDKGAAPIDDMVTAWDAGDLSKLETSVSGDMRTKHPEVYRRLVSDRNRDFADQIKARLAGSGGTVFVAVGAGHFVGPEGLIAELAKRGVKAQRIQ